MAERVVRGMYGREACVTVQDDPNCYDREQQIEFATQILLADLLRFRPPVEVTENDLTLRSSGSQTSAFYAPPEGYISLPPHDYISLQCGLPLDRIYCLPV